MKSPESEFKYSLMRENFTLLLVCRQASANKTTQLSHIDAANSLSTTSSVLFLEDFQSAAIIYTCFCFKCCRTFIITFGDECDDGWARSVISNDG